MKYIEKKFNLQNQVVVITGAGGHICGAVAEGFAKAGARLALLDIRKKNIDKKSFLKKMPTKNYISLECDVTKKDQIVESFNTILKKFGAVDILINGSGINSPSKFFDISEDEWDSILSVNLKGTMLCCQIFGKHMCKKRKGSIINISSVSSGPPLSKAFTYSVSKAAIKNLTQNLAREWASDNVRVNSIKPGFFPTKWNLENFITNKRKNDILSHTPMQRFGKPDELIGAFIWLSSDASSFVTGAEITIDGGFSSCTI
ncbi:MAG: gluconate 5-dehydrogenase [Gammaproteobacteria bacterium]|nr:gluconate 5-dehydrogenase [Gammaproteobacteria bacterium]MAQ73585.1 gluconate 5-dehydrogenase [Gammaproteobacteria bacterium]